MVNQIAILADIVATRGTLSESRFSKNYLASAMETDLVLGRSVDGELGLYGASSECLVYYLGAADADLFEAIAKRLRQETANEESSLWDESGEVTQ